MLKIENITAFYGDLQALWGVSLEVNQGELVALVGPNGAGKTTTLKAITNLLKPATGSPIVNPLRDIVLGCHWVTKLKPEASGEGKIFSSKNEAILASDTGAIDLRAKIKIKIDKEFLETSVGRVLFNNALPDGLFFQNEEMSVKELEKLTARLIAKYDKEICEKALDKIKNLGFEYSTISGITWGMDDLLVPESKKKLIAEAEKNIEVIDQHYKRGLLSQEEKTDKAIEVWQKTKAEIEKSLRTTLPPLGPVLAIINSGARGTWSQLVQMTGMKGLVTNPAGQILELPVKSSFKEGFDVLEYFISTHGARKGTADTALRTSAAGYLTRRLVDVAHDVVVSTEDCKDKEGIVIFREDADRIGQNFLYKIIGRVTTKGEVINEEKAASIIEKGIDKINVRSPLSCKATYGICRKCYGWNLGTNQLADLGSAVGVIADQAIGEPETQLTM